MVGGPVADEDQPRVVRHVQPLVGVGRPGVGGIHAADPVAQRGHGRGPDPERAVDVDPGAALVRDRDQPVERIEGPGIHVAGLAADDDRAIDRRERFAQRLGTHPALIVRGDPPDALALTPQAQHLERGVDRDMGPLVGDHGHRGRALQALPLDVPAGGGEDTVPGRGKRREVGHRGAGHETNARLGRQAQQFDEPSTGDLLRHGGRRRDDVQRCVLVPGRSQPVRGQRGRQAPADDEPEEARAGRGDQAGVRGRRQAFDHLERIRRALRDWPAKGVAQRGQVDRSADRTILKRAEKVVGEASGSAQELQVVGHRCLLDTRRQRCGRRSATVRVWC